MSALHLTYSVERYFAIGRSLTANTDHLSVKQDFATAVCNWGQNNNEQHVPPVRTRRSSGELRCSLHMTSHCHSYTR